MIELRAERGYWAARYGRWGAFLFERTESATSGQLKRLAEQNLEQKRENSRSKDMSAACPFNMGRSEAQARSWRNCVLSLPQAEMMPFLDTPGYMDLWMIGYWME